MAPSSQSGPAKPKRDIADFFRPYVRMNQPQNQNLAIPAKRPSPSSSDESDGAAERRRKIESPKTPSTSRHIHHFTSPFKSPFAPGSAASVKIPLRSPKPTATHLPLNFDSPSPYKTSPLSSTHQTPTQRDKPISFSEVPPSTQSIFEDGRRVAVRDSDGDDSDSLISLSDLFQRSREDATDSSSPPDLDENGLEAARQQTLSMFTNGRSKPLVGRDELRQLALKSKGYNVDMSRLVADHNQNQETEKTVQKAKDGYQAAEEQARLRRKNLDSKTILASFTGNEGTYDRLNKAVERLEALSVVPTWSLFDSRGPNPATPKWHPPLETLKESSPWIGPLCETSTRDRLLTSGYLVPLQAQQDAPVTTGWTQTCFSSDEPREDLRRACMDLAAAESSRWTSPATSLEPLIMKAMEDLGADPEKVKCSGEMTAEDPSPTNHHHQRERRLLSLVTTLVRISPKLDATALQRSTQMLMRLALDHDLMQGSSICLVVEDAITRFLQHDSIAESVAACILTDMGRHVKDAHLQAQILSHILPQSPTIAALRVRLATKFLLGPDQDIKSQSGQLQIDLDALTIWLETTRRDVARPGRDYDYSRLCALIQILDIALADGGRPLSFTDPNHEANFNAKVDLLADRVNAISSAIPDGGTTHLRRSEAKETLRTLYPRLQYAVRTKPPPKHNVFASKSEETQRSASVMKNFLKK